MAEGMTQGTPLASTSTATTHGHYEAVWLHNAPQ